MPTVIPSPLNVQKPHATPLIDVQRKCALRLTIHQGLSSKSMQQQQSWLIQVNGIKVIIVHSKMKHKSTTMLRVIRS